MKLEAESTSPRPHHLNTPSQTTDPQIRRLTTPIQSQRDKQSRSPSLVRQTLSSIKFPSLPFRSGLSERHSAVDAIITFTFAQRALVVFHPVPPTNSRISQRGMGISRPLEGYAIFLHQTTFAALFCVLDRPNPAGFQLCGERGGDPSEAAGTVAVAGGCDGCGGAV